MKVGFVLAASAVALLAPRQAGAQLFPFSKQDLLDYTAQNPFDRFPDGRPKVPDSMLDRAREMSSEEVWAVLPGKAVSRLLRICDPDNTLPLVQSVHATLVADADDPESSRLFQLIPKPR